MKFKRQLIAVFAAASIGFMAGSITSGQAEDAGPDLRQAQQAAPAPQLRIQKMKGSVKDDLRRVTLLLKYLSQNPNTEPSTIEDLVNRKVNLERMLAPKNPCPCPAFAGKLPPHPAVTCPGVSQEIRETPARPPFPPASRQPAMGPMKFSLQIPGLPDAISGTIERVPQND